MNQPWEHLSEREVFFRHLALTSFEPPAVQFSRAEGIYLYTSEGECYTDLSAGFSVNNLGYGQPAIVKAIQEQAAKYLHQTVYGEFVQSPQVQLAARLVSVLPSPLDCVYLVNSGAEAIEGAMKLAKRVTGRPLIATFEKAYHGSTQGALSLMGDETLKQKYRPLLPGIIRLRFNCFEDLERITPDVAAVVVEPVQAEAGVVVPGEGFLQALRQRCNGTGTLLVFDEIQTGLGRTGALFAFEKFGVIPDILCLAKALGAGMPLGAFISSKSRMDTLAVNPALGHLTTFGGNPISAAAACAGFDVLIESRLWETVDEKAEILTKGLDAYPHIREVRRAGLLIAIDFQSIELADRMLGFLWKNRLISDRFLFCPTALRLSPPLIITKEEAFEVNKRLHNILNQL
ncbi:MAG: aspartate aminotransferase family protein [Bacteroidales bacterium]